MEPTNPSPTWIYPWKVMSVQPSRSLQRLDQSSWWRAQFGYHLFGLSIAFDTVPHTRLLQKRGGYGNREKVLSWIREFLTNRFQHVVGESASAWGRVTSGVPQGSGTNFVYVVCEWVALHDFQHYEIVCRRHKTLQDNLKFRGFSGHSRWVDDALQMVRQVDAEV